MNWINELTQKLGPFVGGRIYPDESPAAPKLPLIVYQRVGGKRYGYAEQKRPDSEHARIQIMVWAMTRIQADEISSEVERVMIEEIAFQACEALGAPTAQAEAGAYGNRQDFGIWYVR